MYQEKIQNLPARDTWEYMDHEEDYEASYAMALKATESVFMRKGLEIAVIANPDNGFDFFRLCISFTSWSERDCKMTTFRVFEIACAHITSQEKCRLLGLLASGDAALKEAGDGLEDEILFADLGQGSMHEIDETPEESNLQIVPWNFQEEVGPSKDSEDEQNIFMHRGSDILSACRVLNYFDCPPIPLCRLIPYARVRGLRDDVSGLKAAFGKEGIDLYNNWLSHDVDSMNTHSLVVTHIRDKIINTTHICAANHEVHLKGLLEKDQKLIANVRRSHAKGVELWFPLTRKYLGRLVYDVQITKEFQIRKEKVKKAAFKKEEDKILRDIVQKYCDRMGKMLNIVDPSLGTDWLTKVLGLKWGADNWASLEKINMIVTHDAPVQSKILWISLLEADMVIRMAYGLGKSEAAFREWLRREGFFARIYDRANHMVTDFLDVLGGVDLSHDCTLGFYFDEIKHEARPYLYPKEVELEGRRKEVSKTVLPAFPFLARQWTQMSTPDSCMYSTELHDLTAWEIEHCPWWIDMKKGQLLIRERELRQAMIRDDTGGPSCLGKEQVVDSITDDSVMRDIVVMLNVFMFHGSALPVYAKEMAKTMVVDPHYDSLVNEESRR
ncbi:hypothetical protein L7F22_020942 [Adiantum nelumboides]|nr:hypothetical protein [Adiantum nelumboides]